MFDDRDRWVQLAHDLGLSFNPGLQGVLDSPLAERIHRQEGLDTAKLRAMLDQPFLRAMADKIFVGLAHGRHQGHQVCVHRSRTNDAVGVHVHLFFPKEAAMGLSVFREGFWSRVGKLFGSQDIQCGDAELDGLVMIKATDVERASRLVGDDAVRQALLELFRHSPDFKVHDWGIAHRSQAEFVELAAVRDLLDRVATAADAIAPRL